jgi:hypothetical protein
LLPVSNRAEATAVIIPELVRIRGGSAGSLSGKPYSCIGNAANWVMYLIIGNMRLWIIMNERFARR